ncbi:MazG-like family protein [Streptomyces sp. NPDC101191]|uniref:MazG-like family protein n=1 Tax=Streptomyces sp. NPDC101191 TaxID=3366126 RepID=UPI00380C4379
MTDPIWPTVARLQEWLTDRQRLPPGQEILLRVLKLSEEVGETAQAVIGATGQNPRKGHSHSWQDVEAELCDVIITAMVALRTLTPDAAEVFAGHLKRVAERSLQGPPAEPSAEPPQGPFAEPPEGPSSGPPQEPSAEPPEGPSAGPPEGPSSGPPGGATAGPPGD